jgi:hypothetical protein
MIRSHLPEIEAADAAFLWKAKKGRRMAVPGKISQLQLQAV